MATAAPWLGVIGPARAAPEEEENAERVGRAVAEAGAVLVCGGLGGVMEAACRGASAVGGTSVGLLPGEDRSAANRWVSLAVPTGLGEARNALIVRSADAVIAIGGGWGTLSEIGLALRRGVPVIGLNTWQLVRAGVSVEGVVELGGPQEAVQEALRRAGEAGHVRQPRAAD